MVLEILQLLLIGYLFYKQYVEKSEKQQHCKCGNLTIKKLEERIKFLEKNAILQN